ncbi:MAG: ABC transporter ATP-binding protein [Dongiaceae bacterium]
MARTSESVAERRRTRGYGLGKVDTVLAVDEVARQAAALGGNIDKNTLDSLVAGETILALDDLLAGYGTMEILHGLSLRVGAGQSLCLIGPNGAGKSTVLHAIYGFATVMAGTIRMNGENVTSLSSNQKLQRAGIAYILQDSSIFPGMSVEENLWMGGYLLADTKAARQAAERVFERYPRLAERRKQPARVLSGGERRLLEISRALVMEPKLLLVDEPSIGLEPRYIDMVFEILGDLQHKEGKTIVMVEQNARKGLEFADIGYVLVSGELALAGRGADLLDNPEVGRLFLGG